MIWLKLACPIIVPPRCYLGEKRLEASPIVHKKMVGVELPVTGVQVEKWLIWFVSPDFRWLCVTVVMI